MMGQQFDEKNTNPAKVGKCTIRHGLNPFDLHELLGRVDCSP